MKHNQDRSRLFLSLLIFCLSLCGIVSAETGSDYPYQPVPFTQVHFSDTFWLPRMETNRVATIPFAFKQSEDTGRIENFKVAAKLSDKPWVGDFGFNDSDVYKIIEGASYSLMVHPDPKLDKYLDEVISYIAAAQEPDGYLYTAWTARAKKDGKNIACCYINEPWDNIRDSHELYNLGHMYEGAVAHYLATGKRSFLDVAIKSADLIVKTFGADGRTDVPGHQEIEIGLVKLYRATGNKAYLEQAKRFLDRRGVQDEGAYAQKHKPVTQQDEAVGHAVRAGYMYSGMADVAAMTGDASYITAINKIWENVVYTKLYLTGGIGARHAGEAFGDNYELPNRTAYCETCAAIANVYWNHRMFLLHGDAGYIDVMERSLYNNVLSGVSLDGKLFFYPNPLESTGHDRQPWFGCACCPSNICRFLASVPGYVYAVRDNAVYVNLFVNSNADLQVGGKKIAVAQMTRYPWDGTIALKVSPASGGQKFTLKVRIPGWAVNQPVPGKLYSVLHPTEGEISLSVNGAPMDVKADKGFAAIEREWKDGDVVQLGLPMAPQRIVCDERVKDNIGRVAIQRGPLVYCLEWPDVKGGKLFNLMLPDTAKLTVTQKPDLLNGLTAIEGTAIELRKTASPGVMERTERKFAAIPYYAWAHRGKGQMMVWVPRNEKNASPLPSPTIASTSKVSTSFLSNVGGTKTEYVNDQLVPDSSGDESKGFLHWWPHKGTTEWVQYDFDGVKEVGSVSVYWFDDTGRGECRVPKAWKVLYRDNGQWKPVNNFSDYKVTKDDMDRLSFTPVKTNALRMEITCQPGYSTGVHEWTVN